MARGSPEIRRGYARYPIETAIPAPSDQASSRNCDILAHSLCQLGPNAAWPKAKSLLPRGLQQLQAMQRALDLFQGHVWNGLQVDHGRFGCQLGEERAQARGQGQGMAVFAAKVEAAPHPLEVA